MFELDPESRAELDEFCTGLSDSQATYLRAVIDRVCADPSGRRQPRHSFTRPFQNPQAYVPNLPSDLKVWELKTNRYRGLFVTAEVEVKGVTHRRLAFVSVGGRRFMLAAEAPWH